MIITVDTFDSRTEDSREASDRERDALFCFQASVEKFSHDTYELDLLAKTDIHDADYILLGERSPWDSYGQLTDNGKYIFHKICRQTLRVYEALLMIDDAYLVVDEMLPLGDQRDLELCRAFMARHPATPAHRGG